jgi:hypothetical protein
MNIVWDTIQDSEISASGGTVDITRGAYVSDIPAADQSDPYVLLRAMQLAVSQAGQSPPGTVGFVLSALTVRPAKGTNDARVSVTYTSPNPDPKSGQAVRWVVEDDSTLASESTEIDLLNEPLHADYMPPAAAAAAPSGAFPGGIMQDASAMPYPFRANVLRPRRVLSVHGYLIGKPGAVVLDALGCVNDRPWPTGSLFRDDPPKRKGCWLCSSVSAEVERPGISPIVLPKQVYRVAASFTARGKMVDGSGELRGDRDWSQWGVFHNFLGRIPRDVIDNFKAVQVLAAAPYQVGQITGQKKGAVNGYCKAGNYPVYDFKAAYGF